MEQPRGLVRVGTRKYKGKGHVDPRYPGFTPILCLTKSTAYGDISPYALTVPMKFPGDDKQYNVLMERF